MLLVDAERQEHVAGHESRVAGSDEQHAAHDCRAGHLDGPAVTWHSIDCVEPRADPETGAVGLAFRRRHTAPDIGGGAGNQLAHPYRFACLEEDGEDGILQRDGGEM